MAIAGYAPQYALIGELAFSDGTLDLNGVLTTAAFDTLEVARAGRGTVYVNGAELTVGELLMGTEASGLAELDVQGRQGAVITTHLAIIGGASTGDLGATLPFAGATLQVTQGGNFKAPLAVIGREVGGTGFLAVSDESSQLTIDSNLYVGDHGTGALMVTDHGAAPAFNLLAVATAAMRKAAPFDNGAQLLIHRLTVGGAGAGHFVLDGEGGLAHIDELMIGASAGGDGTVEINLPLATRGRGVRVAYSKDYVLAIVTSLPYQRL